MAGKDLEIRCPECGLRIRLDPRTGAVIAHSRDERPRDLGEAARQHEDRKSAKDEAFRSAMAAEKGRKQELDDLFRQAAEKAKQDDGEKRPDQPLDDRWR
jgi:hypothetical protein